MLCPSPAGTNLNSKKKCWLLWPRCGDSQEPTPKLPSNVALLSSSGCYNLALPGVSQSRSHAQQWVLRPCFAWSLPSLSSHECKLVLYPVPRSSSGFPLLVLFISAALIISGVCSLIHGSPQQSFHICQASPHSLHSNLPQCPSS